MKPVLLSGQAIIDGVFVRSGRFVSVAMRQSDRGILVRSVFFESAIQSRSIFRIPFLRGIVFFSEQLYQTIEQLSHSMQVLSGEHKKTLSSSAVVLALFLACLFGLSLFVVVPEQFAEWTMKYYFLDAGTDSLQYRFLNAFFRILILLGYAWLLSRWAPVKDMLKFQTAIQKVIGAFSEGIDLKLDAVRTVSARSGLHPLVSIFSILVLSVFFVSVAAPSFLLAFEEYPVVASNMVNVLFRILFLGLIAGIVFEIQMRVGTWTDWIQRFWLPEPEDSHFEVAFVCVRQLFRLEKGVPSPGSQRVLGAAVDGEVYTEEEFLIKKLDELGAVSARPEDFYV